MVHKEFVFTLAILALLATGCQSAMILVGGIQPCQNQTNDPSLKLALEKIEPCLGLVEVNASACVVFQELSNNTVVQGCGNYTQCKYQVVSGLNYFLTYETNVGIIEYKAYVIYWEQDESKRVQISAKITELYKKEITCPEPTPAASSATSPPPANATAPTPTTAGASAGPPPPM